jgi:cell division protein FtsB
MKRVPLFFLVISLACLLPGFLRAQEEGYQQTYEMSPLEQSFKQRYEILFAQAEDLRKQIGDLQDLKDRADYIIDVVQNQPSTNPGQTADKYNQLELLLPVGVRFSRDLQRKQAQMDQLIARREALKAELLRWRGSLPSWWVE